MRITIYRTDEGYTLQPQLGSVRWDLELAADVEVREERLLGTLRVYREELAHPLDTALALGWLKPAVPAAEEGPKVGHPSRSLLYTLMGVGPAVDA